MPRPTNCFLLLFVCLMSESMAAMAQAPPAPAGVEILPAPAAQPVPNLRRERIRNLGVQLLDSLTNRPSANGATPNRPLDFVQINETLATIIRPILAGDASLESLHVVFDPARTNLDKDVLRLSADTVLRHSQWSPAPTRLHLDGGALATLGIPGGATAEADSQIVLQTAIVPLADFGLQRYKARPVDPAQTGSATAASVARDEIRAYLLGIERITSLEDVVDIYQHISSLLFRATNENVNQIKQALEQAADPDARQRLTTQLADARLQREMTMTIRTRIVRDTSGQVRALMVSMAKPEADPAPRRLMILGDSIQVERFEVAITDQELNATVGARIIKGVEMYVLLKPIIVGTLARLQARDPATVEAQQAILRGLVDRLRLLLDSGEILR